MESSLAGKVALVTGAGPNIGSGLALALASYGARVACNDLRAEQAAKAVARIARAGGDAMAVPGDISNEDEVVAVVRKVLDAWGRIDILVNCAGTQHRGSVLEHDAEAFMRVLRVNNLGTFLPTKHVARSMVERGIKGSIICIASASGWYGQPNGISYATSKGGVINFVRAAAMDLAPHGIRINSFTPISTRPDSPELVAHPERDTGLESGGRNPVAYSGKGVPMGESPTPTDYGHVLAFLASDQARLITGSDFRADGGALAKHWRYQPVQVEHAALPLVSLDRER